MWGEHTRPSPADVDRALTVSTETGTTTTTTPLDTPTLGTPSSRTEVAGRPAGKLRILSANLLDGGFDEASGWERMQAQMDLLAEHDPDIVLLQELRGWERHGWQAGYQAEQLTGLRGFFTYATSGSHQGILIRPGLVPVRFDPLGRTGVPYHHAFCHLRVLLPVAGTTVPLEIASAHLSPFSGEHRLIETRRLADLGMQGRYALVGGDWNSPGHADPIVLPAIERDPVLKARPGYPMVADNSPALVMVINAGFTDTVAHTRPDLVGVATHSGSAVRMDHLYASAALTLAVTDTGMIETKDLSDHDWLAAELDLSRLATPVQARPARSGGGA